MIIGRLTPVTISTSDERYGRLRFVGVPPNMSVRMSASPRPTSSSPFSMASAPATAESSPQPIDTAAIAGISPTIVRAALTSSSATRPCVTTTMPIIGSPSLDVPVVDPAPRIPCLASASPSSLAIITERWRPPVQPTAMVT